VSAPADDEATARIAELWQLGCDTWPGVELDPEVFTAHVRRHCCDGVQLAKLCGADLYLACACAEGNEAAQRAFDGAILAQVPHFVRHIDAQPAFAAEVLQAVRMRLLMRTESEPKIAEYGGLGTLPSFVRVTSVRTALNLKRGAAEVKTTSVDDSALDAMVQSNDIDLQLVREQVRGPFREALREAFRMLPAEQRQAMRLCHAGRFTTDRIGQMMGVHRITVSRWLTAARQFMFGETRRQLKAKLNLDDHELDSLIAVMRSQFEASVSELLKS
jgi:RNA polymerase sigma-70 factor (ECF subfamily)